MKFWGRQKERGFSTEGKRVYAVGDVHGCQALLVRLLQLIEQDGEERAPLPTEIVMLGDYVDRGPDSRGVCELLHLLSVQGGVTCLRGNHEQTMLDVLDGDHEALNFWLKYGGVATLQNWHIPAWMIKEAAYGASGADRLIATFREAVAPDLVDWLRGLPAYHLIGDYLFVHAGIRPKLPLADQAEEDLLWIRQPFLGSRVAHPWRVIHGHSEVESVEIRANRIGLDTGAYRTGRLTAVALENAEYWMVQTSAEG